MGRDAEDGLRVERLSVLLSTVTGITELAVGLLAGSIALISDGIGAVADATVSMIVWMGLRMTRRGRDNRFHFGYYRVETFASLMSALVMIGVGFLIVYESYAALTNRATVKHVEITAIAALIAAIPSFYLGYEKRRVAKAGRWASVALDSYNSILGAVASVIAFAGVSLSGLGFYWGDAAAGMLIAVVIFAVSYSTFKQGSLILMDACMCPDVLETIGVAAIQVDGVKKIHDTRLRRSGPYITGEIHVEVDGEMPVRKADRIAAEVESRIRDTISEIHSITVKVESQRD